MPSVKCLRLLPSSHICCCFGCADSIQYNSAIRIPTKRLGVYIPWILIINNLYTAVPFVFYWLWSKTLPPVAYKTLTYLWKLEQNWQPVCLILPLTVKTGKGEYNYVLVCSSNVTVVAF